MFYTDFVGMCYFNMSFQILPTQPKKTDGKVSDGFV